MEACVGAHHLSRKLGIAWSRCQLMPAKYVRPIEGQKNDFNDAEAIAEAVSADDEVRGDKTAEPTGSAGHCIGCASG